MAAAVRIKSRNRKYGSTFCMATPPNAKLHMPAPCFTLLLLLAVSTALNISCKRKISTTNPTASDAMPSLLICHQCTRMHKFTLRHGPTAMSNEPRMLTFLILILSGDIELNPGPKATQRQNEPTIYPCGLLWTKCWLVSWRYLLWQLRSMAPPIVYRAMHCWLLAPTETKCLMDVL